MQICTGALCVFCPYQVQIQQKIGAEIRPEMMNQDAQDSCWQPHRYWCEPSLRLDVEVKNILSLTKNKQFKSHYFDVELIHYLLRPLII